MSAINKNNESLRNDVEIDSGFWVDNFVLSFYFKSGSYVDIVTDFKVKNKDKRSSQNSEFIFSPFLKQLLLLFILVLFITKGTAQEMKKIDSLRNVISQTEGMPKLRTMEVLFHALLFKTPDKALQIALEMEQLAKKNNWEDKKINALSKQARVYQIKSKYDSLLLITNVGIQLSKQIENDSLLAAFYNYMGIYHEKSGSLDSAIYYYELIIPLKYVKKLALNNNLGLAYAQKGNYHKSIEYLELALREALQQGKVNAEAIICNNIGINHRSVGNLDKAEYYFNKSIELKGQIGDERGKLFALSNLLLLNNLTEDKMNEYSSTALAISKKVEDSFFLRFFLSKKAGWLNQNGRSQEALDIMLPIHQETKKEGGVELIERLAVLARIYYNLGDLEKSEKFALELNILASKSFHFEGLQAARRALLNIYETKKEYEKFYEIAIDYYPKRDSIDKQKSLDRLTYLDNSLKNIEQEKEIELLNNTLSQKEIRRYWILGASLLGGLILSLVIYFRNREVNIQKKLLTQEKKNAEGLEVLNEELKRLDEMKSRFFTNISHELRTPITLITAPLEELTNKHKDALRPEIQSSLQLALRNGKNLLYLVEEILDISKLESDKIQLNETPTTMLPFCRQLHSAFESKAQMLKIKYSFFSTLDEEASYWIDKKRVEKVVNNLLSNAFKFTPNGGEVQLLLEQEKEYLLIHVKDTGRGIPPEDLPHVFERYFQTKRESIAIEGGTGVGLALSKGLAKLMKGELNVESVWGKGSTFTFRIPARLANKNEVEVANEIMPPFAKTAEGLALPLVNLLAKNNQKPHILIVEDNLDMQQLIHSLLADTYNCHIANNGEEAWSSMKDGTLRPAEIDLIISDIMMPQMDGYELVEKIKQHPEWKKQPLIMLTARAHEEDKLQALRMGVDDYLLKPFSPAELKARVANLITNYQLRQTFLEENTASRNFNFETIEAADHVWLENIEKVAIIAMDKKMNFSAAFLAGEMAISERQLLRRLKALTGLTSKQYVQEIKLQKARHLLENKSFNTISEVAYACGFNTPGYFTKVFEKHYGKKPGGYLSN